MKHGARIEIEGKVRQIPIVFISVALRPVA
jgi:hypothetical protein